MVFTVSGRSGAALVLTGLSGAGVDGRVPRYLGLGSGSGAVGSTNVYLVNRTGERIDFTTRNASTAQEVTYTWDVNSIAASGTWGLREFGVFSTSSPATAAGGSLWIREGFAAVTFDGTTELQIQLTLQVY